MTVKQLIKKLSALPEDTVVCVSNRYLYNEGIYKADQIDYWEDEGFVVIESDYKTMLVNPMETR